MRTEERLGGLARSEQLRGHQDLIPGEVAVLGERSNDILEMTFITFTVNVIGF
jgi:hypothetical protein